MVVPQSDQLADQLDTLRTPPAPAQAERRAAVVVALHARDAQDEALLLDALGLNGRRVAVNFSPGGLLARGRR